MELLVIHDAFFKVPTSSAESDSTPTMTSRDRGMRLRGDQAFF